MGGIGFIPEGLVMMMNAQLHFRSMVIDHQLIHQLIIVDGGRRGGGWGVGGAGAQAEGGWWT